MQLIAISILNGSINNVSVSISNVAMALNNITDLLGHHP
jgi:hypothetical protein